MFEKISEELEDDEPIDKTIHIMSFILWIATLGVIVWLPIKFLLYVGIPVYFVVRYLLEAYYVKSKRYKNILKVQGKTHVNKISKTLTVLFYIGCLVFTIINTTISRELHLW